MLVYIVTVAVSAFFVPHYLSIFWEPLRENPWDIVGGVDRHRRARRAQRRRRAGGGEALDLARRRRLRDADPARRSSASRSSSAPRRSSRTSTGASRRPGRTSRSRFPWRCSRTRGSRPSRTSPRRRATRANRAELVQARRGSGLRDLLHASARRALGAPGGGIDGELTTLLALPPEEGGYANDPILGVVENIGLEGLLLDARGDLRRHPRRTILFIATNAGVIGASRITYSMASTASFRRRSGGCIRASRRRGSRSSSSRDRADPRDPPGRRQLRRDAVLARGDALVHRRARVDRAAADDGRRATRIPYRARRTFRSAASSWPLFALLGGVATGVSFLVLVVQNPLTRWVGLGWMVAGLAG